MELGSESIRNITAMTFTPRDLSRKTFNGKEVFSLERAAFSAQGGANFGGMFRGSKPPDSFKMIYSFVEA
jgi:hypothetical protein